MPLSYEPDPADLALSSVPGQEMFDPRKRKFSAEELKPQPMIKKARKVFIPEDLKVSPPSIEHIEHSDQLLAMITWFKPSQPQY